MIDIDKNRIIKEDTFDIQNNDLNNNISTINSVDKLKTCVLKIIDSITANIKQDIVGISWFSVELDISNYSLFSDTNITYLRLENDKEYNSRLEFANTIDANTFKSLEIQAKKLGYRLEKING